MESTLRKKVITYKEWLLRKARSGTTFTVRRAIDDKSVDVTLPASIIKRHELEQPLNHLEAETFKFLDENPHVINVLGDYVVTLARNGHEKYSMDHLVHHLRVQHEIKFRATSEWNLDDHYSPYLARWLNELMDFPFFTIKGVKGEPKFSDKKGRVLVALN